MKIFVLILFSIAAAVQAQDAEVAKVMARVDAVVAQEVGKDAREVAALDQLARAEFKEIAPMGWRAAAALGVAARDPARSVKSKLFAVLFLSKLHDPAAAAPLSEFLLDDTQDPDARAAAASGLGSLELPPAAVRRDFCVEVGQPNLPVVVRDEVLIGLARLGCPDGYFLEKIARSAGPRPSNRELVPVRRALLALSRSRGESSARNLLHLVRWFPENDEARAAALNALAARRNDLTATLAAESLDVVREAMRTETRNPATLVALISIAETFGPEGDDLLIPLASHPDAEVVATAAEALARRRTVRALPVLETISSGALQDPRFSPKDGRPEPASLLARLERAIKSLRRVRASTR